jgi:hypothetical protein
MCAVEHDRGRRRVKNAAFVAFALVLGACTPEETPVQPKSQPAAVAVERAAIATDRQRYVMEEGPFGPETTIVSTFTAPPNQDVYLVNCNGAWGMGLQRQTDDRREHVWSVEMNACMSAPIVVRAGESREGRFVVASGADAAVSSRQTDRKIESGTYRVVWHGVLGSFDANANPPGPDLPLQQRVSAPIFIEAARPFDPSLPSPATPPAEVRSVEPAHGSQAAPDARIRVHLTPGFGDPQLYVDREWIEHARRGDTIEFTPPGRWSPGRHTVRVVYQNEERKLSWYAWSFTVGSPDGRDGGSSPQG